MRRFTVGDIVQHETHGVGVITDLEAAWADTSIATVAFEHGGRHQLMVPEENLKLLRSQLADEHPVECALCSLGACWWREAIIAAANGHPEGGKTHADMRALIGPCAGYVHPGDLEEYPELDPAGYWSRGADVSDLFDEPGAS